MNDVMLLILVVPLVLCPLTSVRRTEGTANFAAITSHITHLEHQVTVLQMQFDTELKSTLDDLVAVKATLKASQEENRSLRSDVRSKCMILNQTFPQFNVTSLKSKLTLVKADIVHMKTACTANRNSITGLTEIVNAVRTNLSYEVHLSYTLTYVQDKDVLIFDDVRGNRGSHYNVSTGVFTAPVGGSYMVWARLPLRRPNSYINVYAHSERRLIGYGHAETSNHSSGIIASLLGVAYLSVGDRVWFTKEAGVPIIHGGHGEFASSYGGAFLRQH